MSGIDVKLATVDATTVALEVLKQPATNSAILGAIAKATGLVKIESVEKGIMQIFGDRLGPEGRRPERQGREGRLSAGSSWASPMATDCSRPPRSGSRM